MNQVSSVITQIKPTTPIDKLPPKQAGLIQMMAAKYSMDPAQFAATVKKTAMPGNATTEEFAAFMMVAHEYKLNPLLKEIYAFPRKGGGIAPMVSIDGWVNIINSNDQLESFSFEMHHDEKGSLFACTCTMKRKDRTAPTVVTEYLSECFRNTEPWKMKYRMLRHKALIQAARYCFGLSGIYDEDEASDQAMRDITPARPRIQDFVTPQGEETQATEMVDEKTGEVTEETKATDTAQPAGAQNDADGDKPASETEQAVQETKADHDTGEVLLALDDPEFGPADAMAWGREYFKTKKPARAPVQIRDKPSLVGAFNQGYDSEELEARKKPTATAAKTVANKEGTSV